MGRAAAKGTTEPTEERTGYALLLALLLVLLLSAAALMVAAQLQSRQALLLDQNRNFHLQNLLDAGVARSLATLSEDRHFEGDLQETLDGGRVELRIRRAGSASRVVELAASFGGESRSARVVIALPPDEAPRVVDYRPTRAGGGGGP